MTSSLEVSGRVTVRGRPALSGLTVELWDATSEVADIGVPYDRLDRVPGFLTRHLGGGPVASTETIADGEFSAGIEDGEQPETYLVRVFEGSTFLGSQAVSAAKAGDRTDDGEPIGSDGGDEPVESNGGWLDVAVSGKGAAAGLGLAGIVTWYVMFRDDGTTPAAEDGDREHGDDDEDSRDDGTAGANGAVGGENGSGTPGDDDELDGGDETGDEDDGNSDDDEGGEDDSDDEGDDDEDDGNGDDEGDGNDDDDEGDEGNGEGETYSVREAVDDGLRTSGPPSFSSDVNEQAKTLYQSDDARQTGVEQSTMRDHVLSVYDGRVLDRDGEPIPDVTVRVKDHSEFGMTATDADGTYAMAVNGGRYYSFVYEKEGYLPIQRRRRVNVRDYDSPGDVVLVGSDENESTKIAMGSDEAQVVSGSRNEDEDGSRSSLLIVPPGTTAGFHNELTFHVVEYTVGERGQEAMPAQLPARTGYTYAVEYLATPTNVPRPFMSTATTHFNQPVVHYNDNFVGFPVGTPAPTGLFERDESRWNPSENGLVVEILDAAGELAEIDVEGNGIAASESELEAVGITEIERRQLAAAYDSGTELWRSPVPHFTPVDVNWPIVPPEEATVPPDVFRDLGRTDAC